MTAAWTLLQLPFYRHQGFGELMSPHFSQNAHGIPKKGNLVQHHLHQIPREKHRRRYAISPASQFDLSMKKQRVRRLVKGS